MSIDYCFHIIYKALEGGNDSMKLKGKRVGVIITGSFCTFEMTIQQLKKIIEEEAEVLPIMSYNAYNLDTKYGKAQDFIHKIEKITRKRNNTYNTRCRTNWYKTLNRCNDNCACNRKYNG